MNKLEFNCLPTMIGSLPHKDAEQACKLSFKYFEKLPAWPQLPKSSFKEGMFTQYSEGFPGIRAEKEELYVNKTASFEKELEALYAAYIENDYSKYAIGKEYAKGFYTFMDLAPTGLELVKGQVTGPISFGLVAKDEDDKAIVYDDTLSDAAAKLLRFKAKWQLEELKKISSNVFINIDEPAMSSYGSAYLPLGKEKIISLLEEVFSGLDCIKGIHCCGNTDWSLILETSVNVINYDAYNYASSLAIYKDKVNEFIAKGNAVSWGIVPTDEEHILQETASSLKDRLEETIAPFARGGIPFKDILRQSLVTPSCGLTMPTEEAAERALELTSELSKKMRSRYL